MPQDQEDERLQHRTMRLIKSEMLTNGKKPTIRAAVTRTEMNSLIGLWTQAQEGDQVYQEAVAAVRQGARSFPSSLSLKVSIAEYGLNKREELLFRGRRWVPDSEPLRTALIQ